MFSQPDSARISNEYVAVRILGGDDLDDDGREFVRRYGIDRFPTLMALTADGAILSRSFPDPSADGILRSMAEAQRDNVAFLAKEAVLTKAPEPASQRELAGLYVGRAQFEQARSVLEGLVSTEAPAVEDQTMLLDVVSRLGDKDARNALLTTLVKTRPEHPDHIDWRVELALSHLPTSVANRQELDALMEGHKVALTGLLAKVEKPNDQAVVRHALASTLSNMGDLAGATAQWRWILDNARNSRVAPEALWNVGHEIFKSARDPFTGNQDVEKLRETLALLEEIVAKHPDHPLADEATYGALPVVRRDIEKQLAKDAAKKAAAEKSGG